MSEAPHLVERPRPPAPHRNALHLVGRVHCAPEATGGAVVVRIVTPDPQHRDAFDVHRIECAGALAAPARKLERGDLVALLGSVHYGAAEYHGAYVRAQTIERAPDTEAPDADALAARLAAHVEADPHTGAEAPDTGPGARRAEPPTKEER